MTIGTFGTKNFYKIIPAIFPAFFLCIFLSCTAGSPSEEEFSSTTISGNLSRGVGGESFRNNLGIYSFAGAAATPLSNYQLYCATVQSPIVEGKGTAEANGNVSLTLNVKSGTIVCSVLDPQGNEVAILTFSDAAETAQSEVMSGGGNIILGTINTNLQTGEAHAKLPSSVTIVAVTLPETTITSKPPNPSVSPDASFQFSSDQTNCTFECKLDSGAWESCSSPKDYTGLGVASHTFQVRTKNAAGYFNRAPAIYAWLIGQEQGAWVVTSTPNAPSGRIWPTAIRSGSEMIVWGGMTDLLYFNTGGRYNPATDSWTATSTTGAPSIRSAHTAVWTGTEMIIWGGQYGSTLYNTGGRYNPTTDSWTTTSTTDVPSERSNHSAVWTGNEMIIWGAGQITGGKYNPSTNSWTTTSTTNVPSSRWYFSAVWAAESNVMIVWGGYDTGNLNTGGKYNPSTNSWTATSTTNAPQARHWPTAVWTGTEMIVWGGGYNSGGRYNPATDSWIATSTTNAPSDRRFNAVVWTGTEMIIWGGLYNDGTDHFYNTGGQYNPLTDSWTSTCATNAPSARDWPIAVWTGTEMIVWGGFDGSSYLNTGGRYVP